MADLVTAPPTAPPIGPPALGGPPRPARTLRGWHQVVAALGIVFAIVSVGWGCFMLADLAGHTSSTTTRTFDAVDHIRLDLDAGSGVTIAGEERDDVVVERKIVQGWRRADAHEEVQGDTLLLDSDCPSFFGTICSVHYTLRVPVGVDVSGHTDGGSARLTNLGAITVSTGGGRITIDRAAGPVEVRSGGGSVVGQGLTSLKVVARTAGGHIDLRFVQPPVTVEARTGGGAIDIVVPKDSAPFNVEANSAFGGSSVNVRTDPEALETIIARSGGGSIEVRYPDPGE